MQNYNSKFKILAAVSVIVVAVIVLSNSTRRAAPESESGPLDSFAQCLAEKEVTMYGAVWCPYCQNEKQRFGDSFKYVPYVECPENPKLCLEKRIEGYPTWIFPDGRRFEGEQGLEKLSAESGCQLDIRQ